MVYIKTVLVSFIYYMYSSFVFIKTVTVIQHIYLILANVVKLGNIKLIDYRLELYK